LLGVLDGLVDHVVRVEFVTLNITLGDELLLALDAYGHVDVRGARLIGHRADRAEEVFARRPREETSEALEVTVALRGVTRLRVDVRAVVVGLPNLNEGIAHGFTFFVEDPPAEPSDHANGRGDPVVNDDQVVVGIERKFVRVERPFGLLRGPREGFGKSTRHGEQRRPEGNLAQEITTGLELGRQRG